MPSNDKSVAVGIAGLGRAGWYLHLLTLQLPVLVEKFRIAAVADPIAARTAEARDVTGCRTYTDLSALVQDDEVELVVVATPSHRHAAHSIAALQAGKHVLCEKPMATTLADADQMLAAAREARRCLTVDQEMRYEPNFRKVQEVIASGALGRILEIRIVDQRFSRRWDWQTLKEYGGGNLNNWATHLLDMGLLLFGEGEPEVCAHLANSELYCGGDAEDYVKIILKGKDKPLVDVEISLACAYPQGRWLVMGTRGTLAGTAKELRWKYFDPRILPPRQVDADPTPDRSYNREKLPWREEVWNASEDTTSGYDLLYLDLYETLRHGAPLAITPESVRQQIAVLEECRRQSAIYA